MINGYSNFFYTSDETRIFFTTNFRPNNLKKNDIVLVFNYGLLCSFDHYKFQVTYLDKLGFKILLHDYRFHYSSGSVEDIKQCSFVNIVKDLKELTDSLGIKKGLHIGHSMGANITLEFAYKYPQNMTGMVLMAATVLAPQECYVQQQYIRYNHSINGQYF